MALIKGIHHVALKCSDAEEYRTVAEFYRDTLGLSVARSDEVLWIFSAINLYGDDMVDKGRVVYPAF